MKAILVISSVIIALGLIFYFFNYQLVIGQTTDNQTLIESASLTFVNCDIIKENPNSDLNSLLEQQCDHNIKFLKGLCESTTADYDYCKDTKMDSYLIVRGQIDAPRPNDVWCNIYIEKCIDLAVRSFVIEGFKEEFGDLADIDGINDTLEELKEKQEQ